MNSRFNVSHVDDMYFKAQTFRAICYLMIFKYFDLVYINGYQVFISVLDKTTKDAKQ